MLYETKTKCDNSKEELGQLNRIGGINRYGSCSGPCSERVGLDFLSWYDKVGNPYI